jgi:hypothetical protein
VPASASLSIAAVADVLAPGLRDVLGGVVDPRKRRGVRHGLVVVLAAAVCAVVAGARSFVAVAECRSRTGCTGATNIAKALRYHGRDTLRALRLLKII